MEIADFVVVGSSGGGGTIAWLLAKAGLDVVVIEAGSDIAKPVVAGGADYNPVTHDEYKYRLQRPDPKRRPRGDYNTFRQSEAAAAAPFDAAWTASVLGGGSIIWGTWAFRALPIDFRLRTHFHKTGQLAELDGMGYSIPDWPVQYSEMEPFYNVAETLLAVSGDRQAVNRAVTQSAWYKQFESEDHFKNAGNWEPSFEFPCPVYPTTPVGHFIFKGMEHALGDGYPQGLYPVPLPVAIVNPGTPEYKTREAIQKALDAWGGSRPGFWDRTAEDLWSERVRSACTLCGFCGEYLCWGRQGPKSGTRVSTLKELRDLPNAEVHADAKAYEVMHDPRTGRATGVRFLDVSDPDHPRPRVQRARNVIVSCGAVQSARLLRMSGPPVGLGNKTNQLGRHAMFHLFGFEATCFLPEAFRGLLRSELGSTGNVTSFANYFVEDDVEAGKWWKGGTLVSTAAKNPLENADRKVTSGLRGTRLLKEMERHPLTVKLRLTGDDLPMPGNRVDLDPKFVDEYGFPVARVTRDFGPAEKKMFKLMQEKLRQVFKHFETTGLLNPQTIKVEETAIVKLIGDHQMGTCRMGDDPATSVVDRNCRLHDTPNVFVVDSSFMPTGFGLNPMVTVVANALRVGTWIVEQTKSGDGLG